MVTEISKRVDGLLFFDGGASSNGDGTFRGGYGFVLHINGKTYKGHGGAVKTTNNVMEFAGLCYGMDMARQLGVTHLVAKGDSKLVVMISNGKWNAKLPHIKRAGQITKAKAQGFTSCVIEWIPREQNKDADILTHIDRPTKSMVESSSSKKQMIFVFGSNLAGVHGAGAALQANKNFGATWGVGVGPSGSSYAIPTKDRDIRTLPLTTVEHYILEFVEYAKAHPDETFQVTQVGCGLAGYTAEDIAPLFKEASENVYFDKAWESHLPGKNFWGTYE